MQSAGCEVWLKENTKFCAIQNNETRELKEVHSKTWIRRRKTRTKQLCQWKRDEDRSYYTLSVGCICIYMTAVGEDSSRSLFRIQWGHKSSKRRIHVRLFTSYFLTSTPFFFFVLFPPLGILLSLSCNNNEEPLPPSIHSFPWSHPPALFECAGCL